LLAVEYRARAPQLRPRPESVNPSYGQQFHHSFRKLLRPNESRLALVDDPVAPFRYVAANLQGDSRLNKKKQKKTFALNPTTLCTLNGRAFTGTSWKLEALKAE